MPGPRAGCRQRLARDQICILGKRPSRQRAVVVDGRHATRTTDAGITGNARRAGIIFGLCSTGLESPSLLARSIANEIAFAAFAAFGTVAGVSVGHFFLLKARRSLSKPQTGTV